MFYKIVLIIFIAIVFISCAETKDEKIKIAIGLINSKSYENAISKLEEIISNDTNSAEAYFYYGVAYEGLREYDKALDSYSKTILVKPNHVKAYHSRAKLNFKIGNFKDVIKDYTIMLSMYNDDLDALFERGRAYYELNDLESACRDWQSASELGNIEATRFYDKLCTKSSQSNPF